MTENGNFDVMRTSDMKRILHMIELPVSFFADIFVCRINAIEAKMQPTNGRKEETLDSMWKKVIRFGKTAEITRFLRVSGACSQNRHNSCRMPCVPRGDSGRFCSNHNMLTCTVQRVLRN